MSETAAAAATAKARKTYTRRTTRDRVVDLLEEAIRLVKARCVEPDTASETKAAQELLAQSKKDFAEAVEMKRQANAALATATALAAPAPALVTKKGTASKKATAPVVTAHVVTAVVPTPKNTTLKVKKAPSCPGGPKAFNEFLKSKRVEVQAELGPTADYPKVRARISELWKESCSAGGAGASKRTTRKVTTAATPGRVNAPVSLPVPQGALTAVTEVSDSKETEAEEEEEKEEEKQENENSLLPAQDYEDLGMDEMFGMRKVRVDGRDLYMTDANKGLFNRNDEDDDPLGEFVGYLRNGKIVEQNAPNTENELT